ncbi:MAG: M48 family metallopeptidase [Candidatus Marinimicrobia bacterium]|nr:M48 family metallopeptidase [Candidatus Neomarinimicrobiota bacterium]MCF7902020.1 M48 family metallopeptidase [Candidatus Neomarinimicrobiota bacterium]
MVTTEKTQNHPGLGTICYVASQRAKRLNITVKSPDFVRVAVPAGIPISAAASFVESHRDWILKQQQRMLTEAHQSSKILVPLPEDITIAARTLSHQISVLAEKYHFRYNRITFRRQRTRWGSCSRENNISLNLKIDSLPTHLQDYILLHELVHTQVKNHGPKFWSTLNKVTANKARQLAIELRRYRLV